jgi:phosphoenolpyruvate-protein kinase (PTS system EI component)
VLDFGADKTPPFLRGMAERGLALLLAERTALAAQLRAIEASARDADLRVLLPMVRGAADVHAVRELTAAPLGAMLETVAAVDAADEIAAAADFLSIGTNDLVADVFGADRFAPGATAAHDPRVLERIARAGEAARARGRTLEVCGEAASDPRMIPLLIGLGVTELSVGAARVRETHACVQALDAAASEALAREAVAAGSAAEVERLLGEAGHAAGQRGDGAGGVLAVGAEP